MYFLLLLQIYPCWCYLWLHLWSRGHKCKQMCDTDVNCVDLISHYLLKHWRCTLENAHLGSNFMVLSSSFVLSGREYTVPSPLRRFLAETVDFFILFCVKATIVLWIMHLNGMRWFEKVFWTKIKYPSWIIPTLNSHRCTTILHIMSQLPQNIKWHACFKHW